MIVLHVAQNISLSCEGLITIILEITAQNHMQLLWMSMLNKGTLKVQPPLDTYVSDKKKTVAMHYYTYCLYIYN